MCSKMEILTFFLPEILLSTKLCNIITGTLRNPALVIFDSKVIFLSIQLTYYLSHACIVYISHTYLTHRNLIVNLGPGEIG